MPTRTPRIEVFCADNVPGCADCTGTFGQPTIDPYGYVRVPLTHAATCPAWRRQHHTGTLLLTRFRPARIDGHPTTAEVVHSARTT
ncbi:hypothetical protein ACFVKB_01900 [Rhodococcus sp. NPDC127530]|uniref:hypothetical protein n=1 Tax=unclassified Rhodococcus (in: high G+C Gram-positive bacteria) TaxID=192944 RepID=UPI0036298DC1